METPFAVAAEAVRDIARWEGHRIYLTSFHALIGQIEPPPGESLAGWRNRLRGLNAAAGILRVLGDHEHAVRALDRRLARPLLCVPTMWLPPPAADESPLTGGTPPAR